MRILDYIFYKFYSFFNLFNDWYPVTATSAFMSFLIVWPFISFMLKKNEIFFAIIALVLFILVNIYYENDKRYLRIIEKYKNKESKTKTFIINIIITILTISYIIANILIMVLIRTHNLNR